MRSSNRTRAKRPYDLAILLGAALWVLCAAVSASAVAAENAFPAMDWGEMLPADDVHLSRAGLEAVLGRKRSFDDTEGSGANSGYGMESGASASPVNHSGSTPAMQFGSFKTVPALDGHRVTLSGFVVPLETDDQGRMTEFLFVPFFGACIHVPPPPPNQMVYARLAKPMTAPELADAYELRGTLRVKRFDAEAASAAYTMDGATLVPKK